jgi:hypothetical protein
VNDSVYTISRGDLTLNDLKFKTGGSIISGSKTSLDIQIAGENISINSLISVLPFNKESFNKFNPSGKVGILAKINGELSSTSVPSIRAAFKVSEGKIELNEQGSRIEGITCMGSYSNGSRRNASTSRLNLSEYSVIFGNNKLQGKLSLDNFITPYFSATLSGTFNAKDLSDILKVEGLKLNKGFLYPDVAININFDSFETLKIDNISGKEISGNIGFKEVSGQIPFYDENLDFLEGNIKLDGEVWFPVINLKLGKNQLSADLVVTNFWEYFVKSSDILAVNGEINSEYLDITEYMRRSDTTESTEFQLPDSIYLKLHCRVNDFIYGKFSASGLETKFNYKPGLLNVSSLEMKTLSGSVSGNGVLIGENDGLMLLQTSCTLNKIDIYNLFYVFNNFWQDFIIAENLKGSASGTLNFSGYISPGLELLTKNLTAESDFVIENGELINFEPVTELSSFVELSELQHIKFSTLKNSILIKDEKVFVPQMDINSSAFNITVSGTHDFDNYFEYKVRLSLNEILAGKAKKVKKENEEFGIIEPEDKGRTNIYLSVTGTPDDFKIRYDKKEAVNKIKSDLHEEKKLLKTILREELGLFQKDSLSNINQDNSYQNDQFILDWEDEKVPPEEPARNQKGKKLKKAEPALEVTWEEEDSELK